jgi:hypothetical protein
VYRRLNLRESFFLVQCNKRLRVQGLGSIWALSFSPSSVWITPYLLYGENAMGVDVTKIGGVLAVLAGKKKSEKSGPFQLIIGHHC